MPEGPSLYILKELVRDFTGQEIVRADGNVRAIDPARLVGQRIEATGTGVGPAPACLRFGS